MLVYFPWRKESDLLGPDDSYEQKIFLPGISDSVLRNKKILEKASSQMDNAFHYVESKPDLFSDQTYKTNNVSGQQENDDLRDLYEKKLDGVEAVTTEDDKTFLQNNGKANNESDGKIATNEILSTKTTSEMNGFVRSFTPNKENFFVILFPG